MLLSKLGKSLRLAWWCGCWCAVQAIVGCSRASPPYTVAEIVNASRPTRCAEEDNVYVKLHADGVRTLRIEARHPPYAGGLRVDSYAPDFTGCNFDEQSHPSDPRYTFTPKRVILWESDRYLLVGNTHETFWRPDEVSFVVNGKVEPQIHLVQMYLKDPAEPKLGRHQFLVLYPPDGYWRAKPIPTLPLNYGVYGTSFLVGPVEEQARPIVEIARVEFVPSTLTFHLTYDDGSRGHMRLLEVDREKVALAYSHDRALPKERPIAAIRSMYVGPDMADTAEVTFRSERERPPTTKPLPMFVRERATEVRFGRSVPSRHNASAPDIWFGGFTR